MDSRLGRCAAAAGCSAVLALLLAVAGWTATAAAQARGDGLDVVEIRPNFFLIGGAGGKNARRGEAGIGEPDGANASRS